MSSRIPSHTFPRHRPQLYAPTGRAIRRAHRYYSFGRPLGPVARAGLSIVLATPGARRLVSGRHDLEVPFDRDIFEQILSAVGGLVEQRSWAVFQSSWHTRRLIVFSFDRRSRCTGVTHVAASGESAYHPALTGEFVTVPPRLGVQQVAEWELLTVGAIPPWHQPHPWDERRIQLVLEDVRSIIGEEIPRPVDASEDLEPAHGDLTPWNLRVDADGRPWLFDWEWAGWAPPHADLLRFALVHGSLVNTNPEELAAWIAARVPIDEIGAAARDWLGHRIYRGLDHRIAGEHDDSLVAEWQQGQVDAAALEILAEGRPT